MNNNNLNNIFKSGMFTSTPQKDSTTPYGTSGKPSVFGSQQPFGASNIFQPSTNNNPLQTNQTPTTTSFGQTSNLGSLFQTQPKPSGSVFGALGSSGSVQPPPTFGSQSTNNWASTSPFGNTSTFPSSTPSYTPSFGSFQSTSQSIGSLKNGTRDTPYQDTKVKDGIGTIEIKHINAMNEYSRKSNDELRVEDYNLGRKAITSGSTNNPLGGFTSTTSFNPPSSNTFNFNPPSSQPLVQPPSTSTTPSFSTNNPFLSPAPVQQTQTPFQTGQSIFQSQSVQPPSFTPPVQQPPSFNFPSSSTSNPFLSPAPVQPLSTTQNLFPQQTMTQSTTVPTTNNPFTLPNNTNFMNNTTFQPTTLSEPSFFNQSTVNQSVSQPPTTSKIVNYEDPFLLSDIKFEKVQKRSTLMNREIPKPIFSHVEKKPLINLTIRPPRTTHKKKIYTEPSPEEAKHLKEIENLIIGFEGKGRIQYLDKVSASEVSITNIEDKITFLKNEVIVSDPPAVGLNKRARVYVEGVFAFSKSQGDFITGKAEKFPLKGIQERFVYGLKVDVYKKFIDYNYETGLYVYEVNHF